MNTTLLPAIRSTVGDWITYVTTLSFQDVARLINSPDEVHERKGLSDWIQREAIESHAEEISRYIQQNEQRFLGSLIVGVYQGAPNWAPLDINFGVDHLGLTESQKVNVEGKIGLLHLSGQEKLFAIDGQHRVAGIKKSLAELGPDHDTCNDQISAIFVAHDEETAEGKARTRRLFTTVNKKAKRVSKAAMIALDEDNGFAIVTRDLIDSHWLFSDDQNSILYSSTGSIPPKEEKAITSVVGLYEIVKDLYPSKNKKRFENERPSNFELRSHLSLVTDFIDLLLENCHELNEVYVRSQKVARYYREQNNHLLFRPVGQRAIAKAVQLLLQRGMSIEESVLALMNVEMRVSNDIWHYILWDPVSENMITNKVALAETQLLRLAGLQVRSVSHENNLNELIQSRGG